MQRNYKTSAQELEQQSTQAMVEENKECSDAMSNSKSSKFVYPGKKLRRHTQRLLRKIKKTGQSRKRLRHNKVLNKEDYFLCKQEHGEKIQMHFQEYLLHMEIEETRNETLKKVEKLDKMYNKVYNKPSNPQAPIKSLVQIPFSFTQDLNPTHGTYDTHEQERESHRSHSSVNDRRNSHASTHATMIDDNFVGKQAFQSDNSCHEDALYSSHSPMNDSLYQNNHHPSISIDTTLVKNQIFLGSVEESLSDTSSVVLIETVTPEERFDCQEIDHPKAKSYSYSRTHEDHDVDQFVYPIKPQNVTNIFPLHVKAPQRPPSASAYEECHASEFNPSRFHSERCVPAFMSRAINGERSNYPSTFEEANMHHRRSPTELYQAEFFPFG